jgi:hypothetical protein
MTLLLSGQEALSRVTAITTPPWWGGAPHNGARPLRRSSRAKLGFLTPRHAGWGVTDERRNPATLSPRADLRPLAPEA